MRRGHNEGFPVEVGFLSIEGSQYGKGSVIDAEELGFNGGRLCRDAYEKIGIESDKECTCHASARSNTIDVHRKRHFTSQIVREDECFFRLCRFGGPLCEQYRYR